MRHFNVTPCIIANILWCQRAGATTRQKEEDQHREGQASLRASETTLLRLSSGWWKDKQDHQWWAFFHAESWWSVEKQPRNIIVCTPKWYKNWKQNVPKKKFYWCFVPSLQWGLPNFWEKGHFDSPSLRLKRHLKFSYQNESVCVHWQSIKW